MLSYSILLFLSKEGMLAYSAFSVIELTQQKVVGLGLPGQPVLSESSHGLCHAGCREP